MFALLYMSVVSSQWPPSCPRMSVEIASKPGSKQTRDYPLWRYMCPRQETCHCLKRYVCALQSSAANDHVLHSCVYLQENSRVVPDRSRRVPLHLSGTCKAKAPSQIPVGMSGTRGHLRRSKIKDPYVKVGGIFLMARQSTDVLTTCICDPLRPPDSSDHYGSYRRDERILKSGVTCRYGGCAARSTTPARSCGFITT